MNVILFGAPGSGKGTISELLSKELKLVHISTGDMFRSYVSSGSELGKKAQGFMNSGMLVPDEIVIGMVEDRLKQPDAKNGVIFDGFPRTLAQAKALDKVCKIDKIVLIDITHEAVINRLTNRRMCTKCSAITNTRWLVDGKCQKCGGVVYQRDDDKESVIKERLETYETQTKPLIEYYKKAGRLQTMIAKQEVADNLKDAKALICN